MDPAMAQAVYPRRSPNSARSLGKQTQEVSAAVAVLLEQFPLYNRDSLMDVLKVGRVCCLSYWVCALMDVLQQP